MMEIITMPQIKPVAFIIGFWIGFFLVTSSRTVFYNHLAYKYWQIIWKKDITFIGLSPYKSRRYLFKCFIGIYKGLYHVIKDKLKYKDLKLEFFIDCTIDIMNSFLMASSFLMYYTNYNIENGSFYSAFNIDLDKVHGYDTNIKFELNRKSLSIWYAKSLNEDEIEYFLIFRIFLDDIEIPFIDYDMHHNVAALHSYDIKNLYSFKNAILSAYATLISEIAEAGYSNELPIAEAIKYGITEEKEIFIKQFNENPDTHFIDKFDFVKTKHDDYIMTIEGAIIKYTYDEEEKRFKQIFLHTFSTNLIIEKMIDEKYDIRVLSSNQASTPVLIYLNTIERSSAEELYEQFKYLETSFDKFFAMKEGDKL